MIGLTSISGESPLSVKGTLYLLSDVSALSFRPQKLATEAPLASIPAKLLPLAWILDPDKHRSITDRILARIVQAEAHESDVWRKDDYRQAFVCVSLAAKGNPIPFIESSYICYGLHPDKVWPSIVARRKSDLGKLYSQFCDESDNLRPNLEMAQWSSPTSSQILPRLVHDRQTSARSSTEKKGANGSRVRSEPGVTDGEFGASRRPTKLEPAETPSAGQRCDAASNLVPKKPSQSVRPKKEEKIA